MRRRLSITLGSTLLTIAIAIFLPACGTSGNSNPLNRITVTPAQVSIDVAQTQQYAATGYYKNGTTQDVTSSAAWTSSDASTATITSSGGLATGVAPGSTNIVANAAGISSAPVVLNVNVPIVLTSIAITPTNPVLTVGATVQFGAYGTYEDGSTQNITSSVAWTSSDAAVATISPGGLASGISPGTSTIEASLAGLNDTAALTVNAP
jgi:uncharacterized protein YjdB